MGDEARKNCYARLSWLAELNKPSSIDRLLGYDYNVLESKDPSDARQATAYLRTLIDLRTEYLTRQQYIDTPNRIGYLYETGIGTPINPQEATIWFIRASDRGASKSLWAAARVSKKHAKNKEDHQKAEQLLGRFLANQQSFFEERPGEYVGWLEISAQAGFSSSAFQLANINERGLYGVPPDKAKAAYWKSLAQEAKINEDK